jgi:hypothetical protein
MSSKKAPGKKQLRSFGLILAGGFTVIALGPLIRGHNYRSWALVVAIVFGLAGLIVPMALGPLFGVWMKLGEVLAWINTRIILTILYYGLIVPTGMILRMTGKDPMRLKFERDVDTYRIVRAKRQASHMLRQY